MMTTENETGSSTAAMSPDQIWEGLDHMDEEETLLRLLPAILFLLIICVCGLVGNTLVLIVYKKYFSLNASTVLIMSVAIFDLLSNLLCIPGEVVDVLHSYRFTSDSWCKFFRFNNVFTASASVLILVMICVERYMKICRYFKPQLTAKHAYKMAACVTVTACIMSLPAAIVYGVKTKDVVYQNRTIQAYECNISDEYENSIFPTLFKFGQFLCFLVSASILVGLYGRIGYFVYKNNERRKSLGCSVIRPSERQHKDSRSSLQTDVDGRTTSSSDDNVFHGQPVDGHSSSSSSLDNGNAGIKTDKRSNSISKLAQNFIQKIQPKKQSNASEGSIPEKYTVNRHKAQSFLTKYKTTLMLFTITAAFIISYLPHLIISVIKIARSGFVAGLSDAEYMVYTTFLRSYFLNTAINPLIYCFWNKRFREGIVAVFCKKKKNLPVPGKGTIKFDVNSM